MLKFNTSEEFVKAVKDSILISYLQNNGFKYYSKEEIIKHYLDYKKWVPGVVNVEVDQEKSKVDVIAVQITYLPTLMPKYTNIDLKFKI